MAGFKPGFITGANAKIKIGSKTLAYCQDVSYSIDVATIPIESMGKYEVHSYEPTSYTVNGTFSVIRYTKNAANNTGGVIQDASAGGNHPDGIGFADHLNPASLLVSSTFDLDIFEKRNRASSESDTPVFRVSDCRVVRRSMTLNKRGVMTDSYQYMGILAGDVDSSASGTDLSVSHSGNKDLGA